MTFKKGASGNPGGYPKGRPHRLTAQVCALVEKDGGAIVEKIIESAENGALKPGASFSGVCYRIRTGASAGRQSETMPAERSAQRPYRPWGHTNQGEGLFADRADGRYR